MSLHVFHLKELQASEEMARRRAEGCEALELEVTRLKELVCRVEMSSERCSAALADKAEAEERAQCATRRAEMSEQRASAAANSAKSLEEQLVVVTTDLASCRSALEVAKSAECRSRGLTDAAQAKLVEIKAELDACVLDNASLRHQVKAGEVALHNFSLEKEACQKDQEKLQADLIQEKRRCEELTQRMSTLEKELTELRQVEEQRRKELVDFQKREKRHSVLLEEREKSLIWSKEELCEAQREATAAHEQVIPLQAEASRCRAEAQSATQQAQHRRLEAEATRMAHYEQDTWHIMAHYALQTSLLSSFRTCSGP